MAIARVWEGAAVLERAGKMRFATIRGILAQNKQRIFLKTDDQQVYVVDTGRMTCARLDHLMGARVEVKGLVDSDAPESKIHVIYLKG